MFQRGPSKSGVMPRGGRKFLPWDIASRKGTGLRKMFDELDFDTEQFTDELALGLSSFEGTASKDLHQAMIEAAPMFREQKKRNACARRLKAKVEARKAEEERKTEEARKAEEAREVEA